MIYLIRHGETVWNREERYQGRQDSPLTKKGIGQAKIIAEILYKNNYKPNDGHNRKYVSPLPRTKQFASLICDEYNVIATSNKIPLSDQLSFQEFYEHEGLVEQSFGDLEGDRICALKDINKNQWQIRKKYKWDFIPPNGESYSMTFNRIVSELGDILFPMVSSENSHIIVTHGVVSRMIRGLLYNLSSKEILKLDHPQNKLFKLTKKKVEILTQ